MLNVKISGVEAGSQYAIIYCLKNLQMKMFQTNYSSKSEEEAAYFQLINGKEILSITLENPQGEVIAEFDA